MPCACFSSSTAELLALIYGTVGLQRVQRRRVKNGTLEINDGAPPSCKIHFAGFTLFRMQRHQWHYKALFPVDSVMRVMFAKEIAGRTGGNRYQIGCGVKPGIAMGFLHSLGMYFLHVRRSGAFNRQEAQKKVSAAHFCAGNGCCSVTCSSLRAMNIPLRCPLFACRGHSV